MNLELTLKIAELEKKVQSAATVAEKNCLIVKNV
jgi:hypothetical protein